MKVRCFQFYVMICTEAVGGWAPPVPSSAVVG